MELEHFHRMVGELEAHSRRAPAAYKARVALLVLLGFGILALVVGIAGFGIVLLAALALAMAFTGGGALILLLKLGKFLFLLAVPLWVLIRNAARSLFVRLPAPQGLELTRAQAPALFDAMDGMRRRMKGPRFHHVLIVDDVNAAVVQRPAFGLFGWPRNYLLLGLPLLEAMAPDEALAVVAHEYGHLAGAHGRFEAFVYRLRHTWATIQAHADHWQGWSGKPLRKLIGWYAPYFNAYTFVLARRNEYQADAASAELVGAASASHALKRVNVIAPRHQAFVERHFDRIADDAAPPRDLAQRWAEEAAAAPEPETAQRWLADALDREGDAFDTHPVLRARLSALSTVAGMAGTLQHLPPPLALPSAAAAWLGALLPSLREKLASDWADRVAAPWAERHGQVQEQRRRLTALQQQAERSVDEDLELLGLRRALEKDADLRGDFAAFNAAHVDRALGLYLEGLERLDHDDEAGVALLERVIELDPGAVCPVAERLHAHYSKHKNTAKADAWRERWEQRAAMEQQRQREADTLDFKHEVVEARIDDATRTEIQRLLKMAQLSDVAQVYVVRRVLPSDPSFASYVVGVRLTMTAQAFSRHLKVRDALAALSWPLPAMILVFDRSMRRYAKRIAAVNASRVV